MGIESIDLKHGELTQGEISDQASLVLMQAEEEFQAKVDMLQLILDRKESVIMFNNSDVQVMPGTDLHKGILFGIELALNNIGTFPVKIIHEKSEA